MNLPIEADPVPIEWVSDGIARVKGSRVSLDTIVWEYRRGATPVEIAEAYSSVSLPDIYAVIAYYLRHQAAVDAYIEEGAVEGQRLRAFWEERYPPDEIRTRLLARRAQMVAAVDDSPGVR